MNHGTHGVLAASAPLTLCFPPIRELIETQVRINVLSLEQLEQVFTQMRDELFRFLVRRTGNAAVAADLTQDIFEKLPSIQACIPNQEKAKAYLYRVAANLAIDHSRVEGRRTELLHTSFAQREQYEPSTEEVVMLQDQIRQVERALGELPEKVRQVLLMLRIDGLRHKEVASRLGISVSLVEKHQSRALNHCRERLGLATAFA